MGKMKPRKRRSQGNSQREGEGRAKPAREREGPNPDIREGKKGNRAALHKSIFFDRRVAQQLSWKKESD